MAVDLRVLVIADDALARAGLATLLAESPGMMIVGRATSEDDLQAVSEACRPDVLAWDLGWEPTVALERLAGLGEPPRPVVALLPDESHAAQAWSAGARGLLRRDAPPQDLSAALMAVFHGLVALDPAFVSSLALESEGAEPQDWSDHSGISSLVEDLTPRELEVLRLMAEGLPNKTIALRLGISEHTVKFHVNAILGKLGVASRTEAVVRATRLGLILL